MAPTLSSSSRPKHTRNLELSHAHEVKGLTRLSPEKLRMSRYSMLTVKVVKQSGRCTMKVPPAMSCKLALPEGECNGDSIGKNNKVQDTVMTAVCNGDCDGNCDGHGYA